MSRSIRAERVYLDVLGCRLNQSEIERMAGQLAAAGWPLVDSPDRADWIIVNTCAVTATAERKSRQAIHRAHRANPTAHIIVTGCCAELAPERLAALPGVAQVVGNADKEQIVRGLVGRGIPEHLPSTLRSTRAFVKVQDGCDHRCAYCITTRLRGPSCSRPLEEIVCEVRALAARGVREAVLTGVHLGAYGRDLESGASLRGLIAALLEETTMPRLRLSSLEPWDLADDFFDLWRGPRLCPHLHLPLQSGCAATLRRMARRATPEAFARLVGAARAHIPDLALTTDVMVGFPGETDGEFEESYRFVEAMDFARLHVFRYSPRPETAAVRMPDQVPEMLKRARGERFLALGRAQREDFARQYVGRTMDVLWETPRKRTPTGKVWTGLTGNYIRVTAITPPNAENLYNTITPARLLAVRGGELVGEVDGVPTPAGVLSGVPDEFSS
jgi:threonylcarbamoyladenosine tRNA methylthiotransferase MtaB